MAIRSSSWSKHVHRHTVDHPAGSYCNPYPYNTSIGGQDCLTTDDSDTECSTFGSHIHRGVGACCHSLNNAHALAEGTHDLNSQAHHHHHYHQQTSSASHHCNRTAQSHCFEGYQPHLTCHSHSHARNQHHHHHHQQLTHSTHYDGARETSQSCTCSHTYGTETRAHCAGYRGCRGLLTRGCLCRRAYGPPLPGGLMCVGRGRLGCGYRR